MDVDFFNVNIVTQRTLLATVAAVNNTGAITYTWYLSDTNPVPPAGTIVGGNSPTLDIASLTPGTTYWVYCKLQDSVETIYTEILQIVSLSYADQSFNLHDFANKIADTSQNLVHIHWVGDSISSLRNSPRMAQGVRKTWPVKWVGKFVPFDSAAPDEMGQVFVGGGITTAQVSSGAASSNVRNLHSVPMLAMPFASDYAAFTFFYRSVLTNMDAHGLETDDTNPHPSDWIDAAASPKIKLLAVNPDTPASNAMEYVVFVAQTNSVEGTGVTVQPNGEAAGAMTREVTINVTGSPLSSYTALLKTLWAVNETGKSIGCAGAFFYDSTATTGFMLSGNAEGGWSTTDHRSSDVGEDSYHSDGKYTDVHIQNLFAAIGTPTHVFILLGANRSSDEGDESLASCLAFKANIQKVAERYQIITETDIVFVNCYQINAQSDANLKWAERKGAMMKQICVSQGSRYSYIDLHAAVVDEHGDWDSWSPTYIAGAGDVVHQSVAGAKEFSRLIWSVIKRAVTGVGAISGGTRGVLSDG